MTMADMRRALNQRLYPDTQKLLTHVLFDAGYKRYAVNLVTIENERLHGTVWAQCPERIEALYMARGMVAVMIEQLPIAPFKGRVLPGGSMVGDVIVLDEETETGENES